ncbi:MAG: class I SAM-dependent methyltransferase [Candidatus Korarchaeota archaeon]|nr:class I SAM-dependent methyltransferase [Candidatus Korarchaeota archaeon]NIU83651.1 hypothetical protein [Candidatus Thorarchaeota archaeon]NIW15527.1 hypothetical protein [Candidatus Thorarchaeota archaeon]NIW53472.1 hypothetical protein [Candidatus Korarchaeota archaeon]
MFTTYGFGNHPILNQYIRHHKWRKLLEIGVHTGENAKNMVEAANENFPVDQIEYYGFDTFSGVLGRQKQDPNLQKVKRKLRETGCQFKLYKGDSKETLPTHLEELPTMDLIFIDGGHDYPTVRSDWDHARHLMGSHTATFFHNADWQGPRRVLENISRQEYTVELLNPPSDSLMAMVTVSARKS